MNKLKKTAVVRDSNSNPCPFALKIPSACACVGKAIDRMVPVEAVPDEQKESIKRANALVYVYHKTDKKCPYADSILKDFKKVDCDYKDTGQRQPSEQYTGSPVYPQTFSGMGLEGLYAYPLGWYSDNNYSRNLFYGLFSLQGSESVERLVKLADLCDKNDYKDITDKLDKILDEFRSTNEVGLEEKLKKLADILDELKIKYEDERVDSGIMWELISKWYSPRAIVGR